MQFGKRSAARSCGPLCGLRFASSNENFGKRIATAVRDAPIVR